MYKKSMKYWDVMAPFDFFSAFLSPMMDVCFYRSILTPISQLLLQQSRKNTHFELPKKKFHLHFILRGKNLFCLLLRQYRTTKQKISCVTIVLPKQFRDVWHKTKGCFFSQKKNIIREGQKMLDRQSDNFYYYCNSVVMDQFQ